MARLLVTVIGNPMKWSGGMTHWIEEETGTACISVAFSWKLPDAYQVAVWYRQQGFEVLAGGPGTFANKKYLSEVADVGGDIDALVRHNPNATIASRGCPVGCHFCIVPAMEGKEFTLLPEFTPRPILCDNNLSALPAYYQDHIIDKYLKYGVPLLDANSGFEPRTFDKGTFARWSKINKGAWRFGYDEISEKEDVRRMATVLSGVPASKKRVYVLIGNEPFDSCMERIEEVISLGCEPHVQPMMSLNTLIKKPRVKFDWTEKKLKDVARWANRWLWRSFQFSEYK